MKVLIYSRDYNLVKNSGVGKAIDHELKALSTTGVDITTDEKDDFDVVDINTVFPSSLNFAISAAKKGKAVVYHAHSTEEDFKNSFIFSNEMAIAFKHRIKLCYKKGNIIITPSEYSKKILEGYELDRPIEVVSNGIDTSFRTKKSHDRENFYKRYNLESGKKSIISVGLLIKRKGIIDFVELAKRMPEYEFIRFGKLNSALLTKEVKEALRSNLKNLHFPGYIPSNLLREAYSGSDLYVFPTYEETEGIVLLEAISTRAKAIIRDIDIYKKDFADGRNIYKAKNNDEFEAKIRGVLEGKLPDLTKRAYKIAEKRSIENTGRKLVNCYKVACSR